MKKFIVSLFIFIVVALPADAKSPKHNYVPESGYVPDAVTAAKIAEAVWLPIYGKDRIEKQKPFKAELIDETWHISGHLPEQRLGGVAIAEIDKRSGKILRVSHGE
jgi:hypothetical protein